MSTLDIDHVNVGPYLRNTMVSDKNFNREMALEDIYKVMRPENRQQQRQQQNYLTRSFLMKRGMTYQQLEELSLNMRLDLDAPDTMRTLRKDDIISVIRALVDLKDGKGEIDDIDHLGNRRVRSVGELMENQYRVGLLRMERAIRERMSSVEIDTVMPQDLINAAQQLQL